MLSRLPAVLLDPYGPPEWTGWAGLMILVAAFGLLAWWLFLSQQAQPVKLAAPTERVLWIRRLMAILVLLSSLLLRVGASWDELWHRRYGVPFGEDLLWAPHLFLYTSLALTFLLAAYGLSVAVRAEGSLRGRFRREPLLALLGLFSTYTLAFIPVDLVWHAAIGPDLMAESPPHVFGALAGLGVPLTGVALALSTAARPAWRSLVNRPRAVDALTLGILAMLCLSWLQLFTTGWEWPGDVLPGRPGWIYLVTVLLIGAVFAHLALYLTRRIGAATAIALLALAIHSLTVAAFRLYLSPGPLIVAHLLLLPPALALDTWYGLRVLRKSYAPTRLSTRLMRWGGAILYTIVFFAIAFPYVARVMPMPSPDLATRLMTLAIGLAVAVMASSISAEIGARLGEAGRQPATDIEPRSLEAPRRWPDAR